MKRRRRRRKRKKRKKRKKAKAVAVAAVAAVAAVVIAPVQNDANDVTAVNIYVIAPVAASGFTNSIPVPFIAAAIASGVIGVIEYRVIVFTALYPTAIKL